MSSPTANSDAWMAQNKGPSILAICWTVMALSTIFVAGRIYARAFVLGKVFSDDYYTVAALVCGYLSTVFSTVAVSYGNGRHFSLLTTEQKEGVILWTTVAFCPGVMSFGLPKMAVVSLLTRVLNPGPRHKWFLWVMVIWNQLTLLATIGVLLGRCMPANSQWNFSVEGTCFDINILIGYCLYAGSYSAFVDIYLSIYPATVLIQLHMALRKKIALCVALGIGSVSGVVALYKTSRIPGIGSPDYSYDTSDLVIWTIIEGGAIIIGCSIPTLQPLIDVFGLRAMFGSKNSVTDQQLDGYPSQFSPPRFELSDRSRAKPETKDDMDLVDNESQEEILCSTIEHVDRTKDNGVVEIGGTLENGQILRTDQVTVEYGKAESTDGSGPRGWKLV